MSAQELFRATRLLACIFICTSAPSSSFCQVKTAAPIDGMSIDTSIDKIVSRFISPSAFGNLPGEYKDFFYMNSIFTELYMSDTLTFSTLDSASSLIFKSFYYWQHDTLCIDGSYGMFTGFGFAIKIAQNKATVFHLLCSDENPGYSYSPTDTLIFRLEVPCTSQKIILSTLPDSLQHKPIFGYVEFKSGEYYQFNGSAEGVEFLPRAKCRTNMKIYFRATKLPIHRGDSR